MSFLNSVSGRLHELDLLKKIKRQNLRRQPVDFSQARSMGLLIDSRLPEVMDTVRDFVNRLEQGPGSKMARNKYREVKLLAYFNDRAPHENFPFKSFNKKETDWIGRPKSPAAIEFMQTPFDILVNLSIAQLRPLEYISALSNAQLRVGPATAKTYCYDLMIDTAGQDNLAHYIQQIELYLTRLNSSRYENAST